MRISGAIAARALLLGLLATAIGLGSGIAAARLVSSQAQREALASMRTLDLAACRSAPARWRGDGDPDTFAYDGTTYQSANAAAPAYRGPRPLLLDQPHVRSGRTPFGSTTIALRVSERGPCAILQRHWPRQARAALVHTIGWGAIGVGLFGTFVLGAIWIVRPLLRDVARVAAYASELGRVDAAGAPPEGVSSREMMRIAQALAGSHTRIVAAERVASERLLALESHLAEVAHDLRTPLAALQLCVEEAFEQSDHLPPLQTTLARALEECVYLAGLTENLRIATRMREPGAFAERPLDLRELLGRVCSRMQILARRKQMTFSASLGDEPVVSECAPLAVERALSNVIENSVVHGQPGGNVEVRLDVDERAFTLVVDDDGPGLLAERSSPRVGSGLGVRITRQVAQRVGWQFELGPRAPVGTRAIIRGARIPVSEEPALPPT